MSQKKCENGLQTATRWTGNALWTAYWIWLLASLFRKLFAPKPTLLDLPDVKRFTAANSRIMRDVRQAFRQAKANLARYRKDYRSLYAAAHPGDSTKGIRLGHFFLTEEGRDFGRLLFTEIIEPLRKLQLPSKTQVAQRTKIIKWIRALDQKFIRFLEWFEGDTTEEERNRTSLKAYCRINGYQVPKNIDKLKPAILVDPSLSVDHSVTVPDFKPIPELAPRFDPVAYKPPEPSFALAFLAVLAAIGLMFLIAYLHETYLQPVLQSR